MWRRPTIWLLLAFVVVAFFAVRKLVPSAEPKLPLTPPPTYHIPTIFPVDPTLGPADGRVVIIVFSDFQCPFCAQVAPVLRAAVEKHQGVVKLVWKDFPLPQHQAAVPAAEAAQCAAQQGKFWQYHDALFANQARLGDELYQELAGAAALDMIKFGACRREHASQPLITRNLEEAAAARVDSTPYLFINGQPWSGVVTAEELDQLIASVTVR